MAASIPIPKYVDWFPVLFTSWLRKKYGTRLAQVFGLTWDGIAEGARQAIRARFFSEAPADALPYIADERGLFRFPVPALELVERFRARIGDARAQWAVSGAPGGIVKAIFDATYTAIVHESKKDSDTRPNTWDRPNHDVARWAHFWVEIPEGGHDFGTTSWIMGDGTIIGGDLCIGFSKPYSYVKPRLDLLRRLIKKWKQLEMKCDEIIVVLSGTLVGDFTLGDGTIIGGVAAHCAP
jgi:hypothetical protein